ncbi:carbohydrate kinase [Streptomyces pristinaespiralis]|uniref:Sugar kinase n=1 Tax=Streptomyces pristinaespiralis TaxID=38300 RepID=A0A0M3QH27_STRPR|nr:carbohydrate kinase [Streptomyces pristinaespiralis]ALC18823.1 sugar kinase [Streptomyces pristinaespiralis]QMU18036.1 carbohydrate kinase [Streptomyces pristinaespiralis]
MIVVAGEALIDLVPQTGGELPAPLLPARGGGPYNTAVALGRLGADVSFCSRISTDAFGESLIGRLREEGVDTALVQRGPEPTTLAVAAIGPGGSAAYTFYVEGTADRLFTVPPELPAATRALSLGTCALVLEPGASAYEELMRREAARGVFIALDPNIRPGLIPDADAYRARFRSWLPHVSMLKLSEEDADWLGNDVGTWLAAGPAAVVLTHGGDGLTVLTREGDRLSVPGERVRVVDTIGAGDTVNAALLHALSERDLLSPGALGQLPPARWREVLGFAARAAALTCTKAGAEPPYAHELRDDGDGPAAGGS